MKINKAQQQIFQSNLGGEIEFSIEQSASAFVIDMLSSRLYSDPPLAMVRELVTNALDASPPGQSIRLELTFEEPTSLLVVQDFGAGMNPECVEQILTKVGVSSKNQDNNSHGGYGIGILSVFAMSEQAQLDTIADGVYYSYLLYRNANGVPALNLLNKRSADDGEIGTKVQVPINSGTSGLLEYLSRIVAFFGRLIQPQPVVVIRKFSGGLAELPIVQWREGEGYAFVETLNPRTSTQMLASDRFLSFGNPNLIIKVGEIPYIATAELTQSMYSRLMGTTIGMPVTLENFKFGGQRITEGESLLLLMMARNGGTWDVTNYGRYLILPIEIGQLQLTGSREEIPLIQANLDLIEAAALKAVRQMQADYRRRYTDAEDVDLSVKVLVAQSFHISEITYQGRVYQLSDLIQTLSLSSICEDEKGKKIIGVHKWPIHRMIVNGVKPVVITNLRERAKLPAVRRIFAKNKLSHETVFFDDHSLGNYQLLIKKTPDLAYLLEEPPIFKDEIKYRAGVTLESKERKEARRLQKIRESLGAIDNVFFLRSVSSLGRRYSLQDADSRGVDFSRHELFEANPLPEGLIVYHSLDNLGEVDLLAWVALELDVHTCVYLLDEEIISLLKQIRPGDLIPLATVIDLPLSKWVQSHLAPIREVGFFPLINHSCNRKPSLSSLRNFLTSTKVEQESLRRLIDDPGIMEIAPASLRAAYRQFSRDLPIWTILLEYSMPLSLSTQLLDEELSSIRDTGIDHQFSRSLRLLLEPALAKLPFLSELIRYSTLSINHVDDSEASWSKFTQTTAALAWLMQKTETEVADETPVI